MTALLGSGVLFALDQYGYVQSREPLWILITYGVVSLLLSLIIKPRRMQSGNVMQEFIIAGDGTVTSEVFDLSQHPDFELLESSPKGNSYLDSTSSLITTAFREVPGKQRRWLGRLVWCLLTTVSLCCLHIICCLSILACTYGGTAELGVNTVTLPATEGIRMRFVAPEDDTYTFSSTHTDMLWGALYAQLLAENAMSHNGNNAKSFYFTQTMTAGETLYIELHNRGKTTSREVRLHIDRTRMGSSTADASVIDNVSVGSNVVQVGAGQETRVRFTAPATGTYIFTSTGKADTMGKIYNSATATSCVASNDNHNGDLAFRLTHTMISGESVYIGVRLANSSTSGNVLLKINKETPTPTPSPTPTPRPTISSVSVGTTVVNVLAGEITRVKFTAPSSGTYVFTSVNSGDTKGYLYSSATTTSAFTSNNNFGSSRDFRMTYQMNRNDTVYVGVGYSNNASGKVSLNISKATPTPTPSPTPTPEPTISTVGMGTTSVTVRAGEITRVKFTAPSTGTYVFASVNSDDAKGCLYNSATTTSVLTSNDDYGNTHDFRMTYRMTRNQTVYVGVSYYSSSTSGNVSLKISRESSSTTSTSSSIANRGHPTGETCRIIARNDGHARSGPGTNYAEVTVVPYNSTYLILDWEYGNTGKKWYKIRVNGRECWISSGITELE